MRRRDFVTTGALGFGSSLVAGCADRGPDPVVVRRIILGNFDHFETREVAVRVEYDGETIHDDVHEVPVAEGQRLGSVILDDLPEDPGEYRIRVDVVDDELGATNLNPSEMARDNCADVQVTVSEDRPYAIAVHECL